MPVRLPGLRFGFFLLVVRFGCDGEISQGVDGARERMDNKYFRWVFFSYRLREPTGEPMVAFDGNNRFPKIDSQQIRNL